jgi:hypothetical protein
MRIFLVGALIGLWVSTAVACEGQKGKVIFEDTFADDAGGWMFSNDGLAFKAPGAEYRMRPTPQGLATQIANQTFHANEGDYCLEIAFPQDQPDRTFFGVGLLFLLSADDQSYFAVLMSNHGGMVFCRRSVEGECVSLWIADQKADAKLGPGQFNAIEAVVKDNLITVLLNGVPVKAVRAQIPSGSLKFGIRIEASANETLGAAFPVKSFKVTEARKLAPDTKTSP